MAVGYTFPQFDISRNGVIVARGVDFLTCTRSRRINAADELRLTLESSLDATGGDLITWYETGSPPCFYKVNVPERVIQAKGQIALTAAPLAPWSLANTGWPGQGYQTDGGLFSNLVFLDAVSFDTSLAQVQALARALNPDEVPVRFIKVNPAPPTPNTRVIDADTALKALEPICHPSATRWRCRADLNDPPTIEIGLFGTLKPSQVYSPYFRPTAMPLGGDVAVGAGSHLAITATLQDAYTDAVNAVFAEGGSYEHVTYGTRVLTTFGATPPGGYSHQMMLLPDGQYYPILFKDTDPDGNPYPSVRSRRIRIQDIAPNANPVDNKSNPTDVALAAQALMIAAVNYLAIYADGKHTWKVEVQGALSNEFLPGDKIGCALHDEPSGKDFVGDLWVISHDTDWKTGQIVSTLELSNVPDPLFDPLSQQYSGRRFDKIHPNVPV